MWSPGVAGLTTRYIYEGNLPNHGWSWGRTRYQLLSYLIPIVYALVVYVIVWMTGVGGFYNVAFVRRASRGPRLVGAAGRIAAVDVRRVRRHRRDGEQLRDRTWRRDRPILLFADYNSGTRAWYGLTCFTVMVVGISFVYAWMRLNSGSLWTGMLLHASHNLWIQGTFDPLTTDTGRTHFVIGEFGIGLAVAAIVVAVITWQRRSEVSGGSDAHAVHGR
jgi:uncharacterized protein